MKNNNESIKIAYKILLELQSFKRVGYADKENGVLFSNYQNDLSVRESLDALCEVANIHLYEFENELFISPGVNNYIFGYTNDEIRKRLGNNYTAVDGYLALFIMMVIINLFYQENGYSSDPKGVGFDAILEAVTQKIDAIKSGDIERLSKEYEYNFLSIAERWDYLEKVKLTDKGNLSIRGNSSQYAVMRRVCHFLQDEGLVFEDDDVDRLYPKTRFKALVYGFFQSSDNKAIYEFVDNVENTQKMEVL